MDTLANGYHGYSSFYDGLSVVLEKRFSSGLLISVNYTWSKAIDYVDELSPIIQLFGSLPTRINVKNWKGSIGLGFSPAFRRQLRL